MVVQPGLCGTWSETTRPVFSQRGSYKTGPLAQLITGLTVNQGVVTSFNPQYGQFNRDWVTKILMQSFSHLQRFKKGICQFNFIAQELALSTSKLPQGQCGLIGASS